MFKLLVVDSSFFQTEHVNKLWIALILFAELLKCKIGTFLGLLPYRTARASIDLKLHLINNSFIFSTVVNYTLISDWISL